MPALDSRAWVALRPAALTAEAQNISRLRAELATLLRERSRLRRRFAPRGDVPAIFGLTPTEAAFMAVLLVNDQCSREFLYNAMFADRAESEQPGEKAIDVLICKVRGKAGPFGIELQTYRGFGWSMRPDSKAKVLLLMRAEAEATGRPLSDFAAIDFTLHPYRVRSSCSDC